MEAAAQPRELTGEKAQRIVDAMRVAVAARGASGATFDVVAREAGVSRGLLHYYFGSKERLMVEVVRRDTDIRMATLDASLAGAATTEEVIEALVHSLEEVVEHDPGFVTLVFELFTAAQANAEIAAEVSELFRRVRDHVAGLLERKQADGVVHLAAPGTAVATVLLSLGDGLAMRMLLERNGEFGPTLAASIACARTLLGDG